ncbi:MAG: hypothetical protein H6765_10555 [Candidatus Peribacteria bacterium]|nr:MAG: hypothetical protein H6765_10555 [Candidatus Peribacteria bacterium]
MIVHTPVDIRCSDGDVCTDDVCDETLDCQYATHSRGQCAEEFWKKAYLYDHEIVYTINGYIPANLSGETPIPQTITLADLLSGNAEYNGSITWTDGDANLSLT